MIIQYFSFICFFFLFFQKQSLQIGQKGLEKLTEKYKEKFLASTHYPKNITINIEKIRLKLYNFIPFFTYSAVYQNIVDSSITFTDIYFGLSLTAEFNHLSYFEVSHTIQQAFFTVHYPTFKVSEQNDYSFAIDYLCQLDRSVKLNFGNIDEYEIYTSITQNQIIKVNFLEHFDKFISTTILEYPLTVVENTFKKVIKYFVNREFFVDSYDLPKKKATILECTYPSITTADKLGVNVINFKKISLQVSYYMDGGMNYPEAYAEYIELNMNTKKFTFGHIGSIGGDIVTDIIITIFNKSLEYVLDY